VFEIANAKKALAAACRRLGYPPFSQRSLRRMFITRAIEKGVDVKVIAEWQGHKDGGKLILQTYSHVNPVHSNRMAQLMIDGEPENVVPMHETEEKRRLRAARVSGSMAETQPKLQPALLSLSAMISQYFTNPDSVSRRS
jgi:hypothetical protein